MKKRTFKKAAAYILSVAALLIIVLCVHIYVVTRPKAPDANTRVMARIDIKEGLGKEEEGKIISWMYGQYGIDHVLYNAQSRILVFTFFPLKTSADNVVHNFRYAFRIKADRVVATKEELMNGCPVAAASASNKIVSLFKHIFN